MHPFTYNFDSVLKKLDSKPAFEFSYKSIHLRIVTWELYLYKEILGENVCFQGRIGRLSLLLEKGQRARQVPWVPSYLNYDVIATVVTDLQKLQTEQVIWCLRHCSVTLPQTTQCIDLTNNAMFGQFTGETSTNNEFTSTHGTRNTQLSHRTRFSSLSINPLFCLEFVEVASSVNRREFEKARTQGNDSGER